MRKLFSLMAACCAMAAAFGMSAPRASAAQLPNSVLAVKIDQVAVQKARYRCWWRHGYRHCGYRHHRRWWRHHHRHHWRHHYWRRHHRYLHNRHWRHRHAWRNRYYGHRHYYYRPYVRPVHRQYYRYRPYAYCIGLCWW